ncbi:mavicyanin-like [Chenopodium quinoa]|uniref:mavicyanin-like n=1 Tax=Chenopodium quinoa TaxID=63459 RepID=UPI000B796C46|nr:mavicyanin-like [Chenopodium quinoa]
MGITKKPKSFNYFLNIMKFLFISCMFFTFSKSEVITVGGENRWTDGFSYVSWAEKLNFTVGDVLVFSYTKGSHNVLDVTRAAYQSCDNSSGVNAKYETGDDHIELNEAKPYWFICTVDSHCRLGMRFGINVSAPVTTFVNQTGDSSARNHINAGRYLLLVGILSMLIFIV